jgi:hypothetical protein
MMRIPGLRLRRPPAQASHSANPTGQAHLGPLQPPILLGPRLLCVVAVFGFCSAGIGYLGNEPPTVAAQPLRSWETVASDRQGLADAHRAYLDTFVWPVSIPNTDRPTIYVRSAAPFRLRIYRLGWYGGAGAKLAYDSGTTLAARNANTRCGAHSTNPIIAAGERDFGLVECAWHTPVRPALSQPISGLYLAVVTATLSGVTRDNAAMFVVREDASSARLVILNPTNMTAYAHWSDTPDAGFVDTGFTPLNLYGASAGTTRWPRATKVSFNRPKGGADVYDMLKTDYPLFRFLEREGLSYTVATDYDLHLRPGLLKNRRSIVISGHGEYWSFETRTRLEQFITAGGNLIAMAANTGYWQIRYEQSPAKLPGPVVVAYKETALKVDPTSTCREAIVPHSAPWCADPFYTDGDTTNDHFVTTYFRNAPVSRPEQLLLGVQYQKTPPANTFELPLMLLTNEVASMQSVQQGIVQSGLVQSGVYWTDTADPANSQWLGNIGWEADVLHPHVLLQMSPTACLRVLGIAGWKVNAKGNAISEQNADSAAADTQAHVVLYRPTSSSGYVFSGLSMLWSWGLDEWAAVRGFGGPSIGREDQTLKVLTKNMLIAAESSSFGSDCAKPVRLSYHFARTGPSVDGIALLLKESDFPGRWSIIPVKQGHQGTVLGLDPFATAKLSGWAVVSDAYDLFVTDLNGDGIADLLAKEKIPPGHWFVARGDGVAFHVEPLPWLSGWAVVSAAYDLFVADVNGDGRADLVAKERNTPGNWYVAVSGGTSFRPEPAPWLSGWAVVSAAYDLFVADVNGDGRADLVAKERNTPGNWYVAISDGTFFRPEPAPWLSGWAVVSAAYDLFVADVNGDERADPVAREKGGPGNWYVAPSTGSSFVPQVEPMLKH